MKEAIPERPAGRCTPPFEAISKGPSDGTPWTPVLVASTGVQGVPPEKPAEKLLIPVKQILLWAM